MFSVPADRRIKANFDRDVVLDLSTRELEYEHEMFPLNIVFDSSIREDWADGYKEYHGYSKEFMESISASAQTCSTRSLDINFP